MLLRHRKLTSGLGPDRTDILDFPAKSSSGSLFEKKRPPAEIVRSPPSDATALRWPFLLPSKLPNSLHELRAGPCQSQAGPVSSQAPAITFDLHCRPL